MDARCRIELFGDIRLLWEDRVISHFRTRKAAHLLACLALPPGRSHTREALVDRFWPDADPHLGRDSLVTALSALRKVLEPHDVPSGTVLVADRLNVRLNAAAVTSDVQECEELLGQAARTPDPLRRAGLLSRAVELSQGELVPDCYDDWIVPEQRRWAERHVDALLAWSQALEETLDLDRALDVAARAGAADPMREEACAQRVRLYAALGRHADARACYREYKLRLEEEAGVQPSPRLCQLMQELRAGPHAAALIHADHPHAVSRPPGGIPSPVQGMAEVRFARLPRTGNRFCGRSTEIGRLVEWLAPGGESGTGYGGRPAVEDPIPLYARSSAGPCTGSGSRRLVTVTGPGGSGKTRLALEVANLMADAYDGRVAFVPLDAVDDPGRIGRAVARALGLPSSSEVDPLESAAEALGPAPWLLVLDNLEQLLAPRGSADARALLRQMLYLMPHLSCLITSRQALAMHAEQELRLDPLPTPSQAGLECDSVALFVDRVRSMDPGFRLTPDNAGDVAALCERLEGLPLAIEMAAAWTRVLSPRLVRERLDRHPTDLSARHHDASLRHRSLHAALEWSYDLLAPELRHAFAALAVFRGGWSLAAAEAVLGNGALETLADLAERSLVLVDERGARYRYLETVREFAGECLAEQGEEQACERHARYYLDLARETAARAPGLDPAVWSALSPDCQNIGAALEWLLVCCRGQDLAKVVVTLEGFWIEEGHHLNEGVLWADRALSVYTKRDATRAGVLRTSGWLALCQDRYAAARDRYEECLSIAREQEDARAVAAAGIDLARLCAEVGDAAQTKQRSEESLTILRSLNDPSALADGLFALSGVMTTIGDTPAADAWLQESAGLMRALGQRRELAKVLFTLARSARGRGDLETARRLWEECVALDEALGIHGGGALWGLGMLAEQRGDAAEACSWYGRSLTENLASGNHRGVAEGLHDLADVLLRRGAADCAARLLGASLLQQSLTERPFRPQRRRQVDALAGELRERLGCGHCEDLMQEGWRIDPEAAIHRGLTCLREALRQADGRS